MLIFSSIRSFSNLATIQRFRSDFKFPEAATSADGLNPAVTSSGGDEDDELY
jgi:hypothetical protein